MSKNGGYLKTNEDVGVGFIYNDWHYHATEEEQKKLFDKLKEKGLAWDAEKKEVVKIKWKPICGALYYKSGIRGAEINVVSDSWAEDVFDKSYYDKGWVFKTYEE